VTIPECDLNLRKGIGVATFDVIAWLQNAYILITEDQLTFILLL